MKLKITVEIVGAEKTLGVSRVVMAPELLQAVLPAVILREKFEDATRQFFAPDGDNLTERVMAFLNEEREIAELKKAKEEADASFASALERNKKS
jgi:hypothetical protein